MLEFTAREREASILHPMGFAEILDTTFSLYRKHFRLFLGIIAVGFGMSVLQEAIFAFLVEESLYFQLITEFIITTFTGGALVIASSAVYLDEHTTVQAAWRQVRKAIFRYFGGSFLWGFVAILSFACVTLLLGAFFLRYDKARDFVSVGILCSIVLCVLLTVFYFTIAWNFWGFAILIEGKSVRAALKRSRQLVKNTWWRVCGITLAVFFLGLAMLVILGLSWDTLLWFTDVGGVENPVEIILQFVSFDEPTESSNLRSNPLGTLIWDAFEAFVLPIWVIGNMLLYFDLRIRKEAFDLEMMIIHYGGEPVD